MIACDRAGVFRAEVIGKGIKQMDSGAVAMALHVRLLEIWDAEANDGDGCWHPWGEYDMEAYGDVWLVSGADKGNKLIDKSVQRLVRCLGWSGVFSDVNDDWQPTPCQVEIKQEDYKGQTYFKIAWVNGYDDRPGKGNIGNADEATVKSLDARFGSSVKAIASTFKRNAAPTAGKPPAPPKPAPRQPVPAGADDGSIPF